MSKFLRKQKPGTLTEQVEECIREQIGTGALKPGDYLLSERELASSLSVSRVTVRRGLEKLVEEGLLNRVSGKGYVVRSPSDEYTNGGQNSTAFVFLHTHLDDRYLMSDPIHAEIWTGAREEAVRIGRLVMISTIEDEGVSQGKAQELSQIAAGVICDYPDKESIQSLLSAGIPVIQIHYIHYDLSLDTIVQDDIGGMCKAVDYLAGKGHTQIGYLDTSPSLSARNRGAHAERRLLGFTLGCRHTDISAESMIIKSMDFHTPDDPGPMENIIDSRTKAVVIPHFELLPGVLKACSSKGVDPEKDIDLVVWGNPGEELNVPYVFWEKQRMGKEAVQRLQARLDNPEIKPVIIEIPTRLIVPDNKTKE